MADVIRREQLNGLTRADLKAMCNERGLAVGGKNGDLIDRILVHEGHPRPEGDLRFMTKPEVAELPNKVILTAIERFGDNQLSAVPPKRKTCEFMEQACRINPKSLTHSKLGDDLPFVLKLIDDGVRGVYQYASAGKRADRDVAAKAIAQDPMMFLSAPKPLQDDPTFVLPLLALPTSDGDLSHGDLYLYAGQDVRDTPNACLLAARNCTRFKARRVMAYMPPGARQCGDIMLHCIKKDPEAMRDVGHNLKNSLPFANRAAKVNGNVLPFLDERWQSRREVVAHALFQCPKAVLHTTHPVDPILDIMKRVNRDYLTSKAAVFQLVRMFKRSTCADIGTLAPVALLRGQTRAQTTIVEFLMKCTSHPIHNAMPLARLTYMHKAVDQLQLAVHIQQAARR